MKTKILKNQEHAFSELAEILHVHRRKIAEFLTQNDHPLPLPPKLQYSNRFVFDTLYFHELKRWIREEKGSQFEGKFCELDCELIERELSDLENPKKVDWSVEDYLDRFSPANFLG